MENIIWGIIFMLEVMKYILGEKILFKRNVKRKWAGYVGFLIYMCIICFVQITSDQGKYLIMYGLAVAMTYIMVYQKKIEDFVHILVLLIEITCIEGITEKIVAFIARDTGLLDYSKVYQFLITGIVGVAILFLVSMIGKCKRTFQIRNSVEYIWIFVLSIAVCILLTTTVLYVLKEYVSNRRFESSASTISICSYVAVGVLILFITHIKNTNQRLQQLLMTEKQLKKAQQRYYRALLQKEEDTRRNRHDWNNHLICLSELAQKEKADSTKQYIDTLIKQNTHLKEKRYNVGNDVLNAILYYHLSELDDDILVKVVGKCRNDIKIDEVDLCVIVSNLVQNAVEYLKKSKVKEKKLLFSIEEGKVYKKISVVNSVDHNISERTLKITTKSDKRNHGIGLRNVQETIERNGGRLEINIQEGMLSADIIWI